MSERLPIVIVTGFLGSGKTTVIRHLLSAPGMERTLAIVNEFGEVGLDHALLEASSDDTILLANGCLCCTIRGNLVDTLIDVCAQRERGEIGEFDRVVIETSGVADPAPLVAFLIADAAVMARYRLDALVATCDLVNGAETLGRQPEAGAQLALADRILLTKRDLATAETAAVLAARARRLNPAAEIVECVEGRVAAEWLLAPGVARSPPAAHHDHDHTQRFACAILRAGRALSRAEVAALHETLRRVATPSLLRLKGLLRVDYDARQLVVQGALSILGEPYFLAAGAGPAVMALISEGPVEPALIAALAPYGLCEAA